jgi:hypothetical protein
MTKENLIVKNCHFARPCHAEWGKLERTKYRKDIRCCGDCKKQVYLATDQRTLNFAVIMGYCVAMPIELVDKLRSTQIKGGMFRKRMKDYLERKRLQTHVRGAVSPPTDLASKGETT